MIKKVTGFSLLLLVLILSIYAALNYQLPYFKIVLNKAKAVYEQYRVTQDTVSMAVELKEVKYEIRRIDSLLQFQIHRESEVKSSLVEALYIFADSNGLKTSKVEVGERLAVDNRYETSISINGTADRYSSFGKFIESIENYPRSTRIRQIVLKSSLNKGIEGFIDFVFME